MITVQIFKNPKYCIFHNYGDATDFIDSLKTFGSRCVACFQLLRQVKDMHWQASGPETTD